MDRPALVAYLLCGV